jgi:TonB family protein
LTTTGKVVVVRCTRISRWFALSFLCLLLFCAKPKTEQKAASAGGQDTLSTQAVLDVRPDAAGDSMRLGIVPLELALAKSGRAMGMGEGDPAAKTLARDLSLRAGQEWSTEAAASLLAASRAIKSVLDTAHTPSAVKAYLDSLFRVSTGGRAVLAGSLPSTRIPANLPGKKSRRDLLPIYLKAALGVSDVIAQILADYLDTSGTRTGDSASLRKMVKNLVRDRNQPAAPDLPREAVMKSETLETRDNSELALRFRNQQSIQDSIMKHMIVLKAIYKKSLKRNTTMAGTVIIEFRVNAPGKVIAAAVSKSDIRDQEFIDPLLSYMRTIGFRPVPQNVGNMTFEFPFEFSPEE